MDTALVAGSNFAADAGARLDVVAAGSRAALCEFGALIGVEEGRLMVRTLPDSDAAAAARDSAEQVVEAFGTRKHGGVRSPAR